MRYSPLNEDQQMADETTKEQPLVTTEVEVIDQVDDRSIVEMTGQTIQGYVYSIKQGERVVESLTLAGINEAANRRGGIQVKEVVYKETDHSWIATAEAIDTITGNSRYGAYDQPKMNGEHKDPFAFYPRGAKLLSQAEGIRE